jgi:peptidoglycan L-alanyl-D-glutamate endopeptidase CwlK
MYSTSKLNCVHPELVAHVERMLFAMRALGFPMVVTDGVRTLEQQQALYAKGRTAPGPIVTKADGTIVRSNHQPHADGFGHAVDCAFIVNGRPSWDEGLPWPLYGAMAKALGLRWGGDFKSIVDRPHVELP